MAKPNYSFEKRQRELAKKKKQDEKLLKKRAKNEPSSGAGDAVNAPADSASDPGAAQQS